MKRLSGRIDVGSESHHITILDEEDVSVNFSGVVRIKYIYI